MRLYIITVLTIFSLFLVPHPIINAPTPHLAGMVHGAGTTAKYIDPSLVKSGDAASTLLNAGDNVADSSRSFGTLKNSANLGVGPGSPSTASSSDVLNNLRATDDPTSIASTSTRTEPIVDMSKNADAAKMGEAPPVVGQMKEKPTWTLKTVGKKILFSPITVPYKMIRYVFRKITDFRLKLAANLLYKHDPKALTDAKFNEVLFRKQKITKWGKVARWMKMNDGAWMTSKQNRQPVWATNIKDTSGAKWVAKVRSAFKKNQLKPTTFEPTPFGPLATIPEEAVEPLSRTSSFAESPTSTIKNQPGFMDRLKATFRNPFRSSRGTEVGNNPVSGIDDISNPQVLGTERETISQPWYRKLLGSSGDTKGGKNPASSSGVDDLSNPQGLGTETSPMSYTSLTSPEYNNLAYQRLDSPTLQRSNSIR